MLELGGVLEVMRPGHPTHVANKEMEVSREAGWAVRVCGKVSGSLRHRLHAALYLGAL